MFIRTQVNVLEFVTHRRGYQNETRGIKDLGRDEYSRQNSTAKRCDKTSNSVGILHNKRLFRRVAWFKIMVRRMK